MGRSWTRKRSAIPPSRATASSSSKAIGSSESRAEVGERARRGEVPDHHRERLLLAPLALAERRDRRGRGRVAGEVVATEPLHRDDRAAGERGSRHLNRGDTRSAFAELAPPRSPRSLRGSLIRLPLRSPFDEPDPRAAGGARVRLRVEAPIRGVAVLGRAGGAQAEARHGRGGPVVRRAERDGEAGPAVGAVRERVAMAAVARIAQLREAGVAGGEVGRDGGALLGGGGARDDLEAREALRREGSLDERGDVRGGRVVCAEPRDEGLEGGGRAERLDGDPGGVVPDPPGEPELSREPVDEGAEAYALDRPGDGDPSPLAGHRPGPFGSDVGHGIPRAEGASSEHLTGPLQAATAGVARRFPTTPLPFPLPSGETVRELPIPLP